MTISTRIAGPLLAPIFIGSGWDSIQHPEGKVKAAEAVTKSLSEKLDFLPEDPATLVQINGAVHVGAGVLLAIGRLPRFAALVLAGTLLPTTLAGHRFWEEVDDEDRARQRTHFLKNVAILGGLLAVAAAPSGGSRLRLPVFPKRRAKG
jgi:putative oxidoreductase